MAKKARKPRSQSPRTYAQINPATPAGVATPQKPVQPQGDSVTSGASVGKKGLAVSATKATSVNWSQEYHYVYQDLRRTFILAAALLLLLITLNVAFRLM